MCSTLPAGESAKRWFRFKKIYNAVSENAQSAPQHSSLWGGVIGDMTGLQAATWLRGINLSKYNTVGDGLMLRSEAKPASIIPKAKPDWGIPSAATGFN